MTATIDRKSLMRAPVIRRGHAGSRAIRQPQAGRAERSRSRHQTKAPALSRMQHIHTPTAKPVEARTLSSAEIATAHCTKGQRAPERAAAGSVETAVLGAGHHPRGAIALLEASVGPGAGEGVAIGCGVSALSV